jgi:hypothetical protein
MEMKSDGVVVTATNIEVMIALVNAEINNDVMRWCATSAIATDRNMGNQRPRL